MKKKHKENCKAFYVTRKRKYPFIFISVCQYYNVRMLVFFQTRLGKSLILQKSSATRKFDF